MFGLNDLKHDNHPEHLLITSFVQIHFKREFRAKRWPDEERTLTAAER